MRHFVRPFIAGVALVGLAACSGGSSADPEPSQEPGGALAKVDPCKIMTPQQLRAGGFAFVERSKVLDSQPGCTYDRDAVGLSIYKNQEQTVQSYKENGNWMEYSFIDVNGREGARARVPGAMETCSTMIAAGGGVIQVSAQSGDPRKTIDGCAESLKIAKQIEPNLPE